MHARRTRTAFLWALTLMILTAPSPARAQTQPPPFTLDDLVEIVRAGAIAEARIVTLVGQRCVAFTADDPNLARLRDAGAREPVLNAVRRACRVLPGEPRWVRLAPATLDVTVGRPVRLEPTAVGPDGVELPGALIRWTSSDSSVVHVGPDGRLEARRPGVAYVTALGSNGIASEPATVVVTRPPLERKSTATAVALGAIVPGGGQFYTGHGLKGALLFVGSVATAVAGFAVTTDDLSIVGPVPPSCTPTCTYDVTFEKKRPAVIPTLIAAGGLWAYGIVDAALQAKATQEARGPRPELRLFGEGRVNPDGTVDVPLVQIVF